MNLDDDAQWNTYVKKKALLKKEKTVKLYSQKDKKSLKKDTAKRKSLDSIVKTVVENEKTNNLVGGSIQ